MEQEKRRACAVVFDMDGVIFDSEQLVIDCWMQIADQYGYDREGVRECCLKSLGTTTAATGAIFRERFDPLLRRRVFRAFENTLLAFGILTTVSDGVSAQISSRASSLDWLS